MELEDKRRVDDDDQEERQQWRLYKEKVSLWQRTRYERKTEKPKSIGERHCKIVVN